MQTPLIPHPMRRDKAADQKPVYSQPIAGDRCKMQKQFLHSCSQSSGCSLHNAELPPDAMHLRLFRKNNALVFPKSSNGKMPVPFRANTMFFRLSISGRVRRHQTTYFSLYNSLEKQKKHVIALFFIP